MCMAIQELEYSEWVSEGESRHTSVSSLTASGPQMTLSSSPSPVPGGAGSTWGISTQEDQI